MTPAESSELRDHVLWLLDSKSAHADFDAAVGGLSPRLRGARAKNVPYSPWQLLEHLRLAQRDILDYCVEPGHVSGKWPESYWPKDPEPPSAAAWNASVKGFRSDLQALKKLVSKRARELMKPIPHADGVTLLTEALLVADHNAYHVGELVLLRRALNAW